MTGLFRAGDGETPLSEEDKEGLIPSYVATRGELNAEEQHNILEARFWVRSRKNRIDILDETTLRDLHRRMFGRVWRWAGEWRERETSIGADPRQVPILMRQLADDVRYWIANDTYLLDEIAIRYHHRFEQIHPFRNGNGRTGRFAADILARKLGATPFTWGAGIQDKRAARQQYLDALRTADRDLDFGRLTKFARS
ncbi:MAG: mobile mystery protein B [Alphaproteobacteria bacterium]|nr:mobile mystery protein B [Alphaproteobacteria bacterium]